MLRAEAIFLFYGAPSRVGGGGRSCSFSGDAPLRRYQRRPLPTGNAYAKLRKAKRFAPAKRLPPSTPTTTTFIDKEKEPQ